MSEEAQTTSQIRVIKIEIPELGNRSYIVHDGKSAVVIDASRRIKQVIDAATNENLKIEAVFETHIHNDYVTGGFALAKKLKLPYYVSKHEHVQFERAEIEPDQTVTAGSLSVTAVASPGHTHNHLSYLVEAPGATAALFSGGSLLYGAVGRTDLISAKDTSVLARAQYQTAKLYAKKLDHATLLYPTHGFGSFCAATETENVDISTIGHQLISNQAYTAKDEDSFVAELLDNLEDYPSYYVYMAPANLKGPLEPKLDKPTLLTKEAIKEAVHSGRGIVDMRSRIAYAAKHLKGTYNIELTSDLATYVGWLIRWDEPLILVAETSEEVERAQEQLSLIGRELIAGQSRPAELLAAVTKTSSYPVSQFSDLAKVITDDNVVVIDVRRGSEWRRGHIKTALHIQLHELVVKLPDISSDKEIWVHCASGFRASIAASIIGSSGKNVVLLNDNYNNAQKAGLDIAVGV
jgi:hydroxyacylglutathione hydrolase